MQSASPPNRRNTNQRSFVFSSCAVKIFGFLGEKSTHFGYLYVHALQFRPSKWQGNNESAKSKTCIPLHLFHPSISLLFCSFPECIQSGRLALWHVRCKRRTALHSHNIAQRNADENQALQPREKKQMIRLPHLNS